MPVDYPPEMAYWGGDANQQRDRLYFRRTDPQSDLWDVIEAIGTTTIDDIEHLVVAPVLGFDSPMHVEAVYIGRAGYAPASEQEVEALKTAALAQEQEETP